MNALIFLYFQYFQRNIKLSVVFFSLAALYKSTRYQFSFVFENKVNQIVFIIPWLVENGEKNELINMKSNANDFKVMHLVKMRILLDFLNILVIDTK